MAEGGGGDEMAAVRLPAGPSTLSELKSFASQPGSEGRWPGWRLRLERLLNSTPFDVTMGLLISFNMCLVVFETDIRGAGEEPPDWSKRVNQCLLGVYVAELGTKVFAQRLEFFAASSNLLDLIVVGVDVLCAALDTVVGSEVSSVSVLRVFRILKLLRTLRVIHHFRELYFMVHGFKSAMKSIVWASFLMGLTIVIWGIVAVEVLHPRVQEISIQGSYDGCERCPRAFSSVWMASLTFIQQIVAGDSWGIVSVPLMEAFPVTSFVLMPALLTIQLGLMNLVLYVIVDQAQEARQEDEKQRIREKELDFRKTKIKLDRIFQSMDSNEDGIVHLEELLKGYDQTKEFADVLALIDLKKDDLETIFRIIDRDGSGAVDREEFFDQMYKLTTQDPRTLLFFIKQTMTDVDEKVTQQARLLKSTQTANESWFGQLLDALPRGTLPVYPYPGFAVAGITPKAVDASSSSPRVSTVFENPSSFSDTSPQRQPHLPLGGSRCRDLRLEHVLRSQEQDISAILREVACQAKDQAAMQSRQFGLLRALASRLSSLLDCADSASMGRCTSPEVCLKATCQATPHPADKEALPVRPHFSPHGPVAPPRPPPPELPAEMPLLEPACGWEVASTAAPPAFDGPPFESQLEPCEPLSPGSTSIFSEAPRSDRHRS